MAIICTLSLLLCLLNFKTGNTSSFQGICFVLLSIQFFPNRSVVFTVLFENQYFFSLFFIIYKSILKKTFCTQVHAFEQDCFQLVCLFFLPVSFHSLAGLLEVLLTNVTDICPSSFIFKSLKKLFFLLVFVLCSTNTI